VAQHTLLLPFWRGHSQADRATEGSCRDRQRLRSDSYLTASMPSMLEQRVRPLTCRRLGIILPDKGPMI
jgi:hypothetical protein